MNKPPKGFWRELSTLDEQLHRTREWRFLTRRVVPIETKTWVWYDPDYIPDPDRADEGRMAARWMGSTVLHGMLAVGSLDVYRIVSNELADDPQNLPDLPAVHEQFVYYVAPMGLREVRYARWLDDFANLTRGQQGSAGAILRAQQRSEMCDYGAMLKYMRYGVEGGPACPPEPPEPPAEPPYVTV